VWIVISPSSNPTYYGPFAKREHAVAFAQTLGPVSFPTPGKVRRLVGAGAAKARPDARPEDSTG
jgi:hypothetical protein